MHHMRRLFLGKIPLIATLCLFLEADIEVLQPRVKDILIAPQSQCFIDRGCATSDLTFNFQIHSVWIPGHRSVQASKQG
jgi:hypothetical protein